jgi:hypothetical protein
MTQYVINIGAVPNDGTGDPLRTAFNETNLNFDQVFAAGPVLSNIQIVNNKILTTNTNGNLVLAPNGTGVVQSNVSIVPNTANIRDLGSSTLRWRNVYTQYVNVSGTATIASANIAGGSITIPVGNIHISGGTNGYVLQTDGTGNLTWTAQTGGSGNGTPGGANTQVQYNDAGAFGGAAGFTFDSGSNVLSVPGSITMSLTPSNAANTIQYGLGNLIGYLDGQWTIGEYNGAEYGTEGIRINPGIEGAADVYLPANQNANVEALTVSNYAGNVAINTATGTWTFNALGQTVFPVLNTQRGDNPSGTISGFTLNGGDGTQEFIITTPNAPANSNSDSQRLVINPGAGDGSGEGGDIYLWAGRGGNVNGNGGDVKIRGGQGTGNGPGGYLRIEAGDTQGNGVPGWIEITGGEGGTTSGGYVQITGGVGGSGTGGAVDIIGGFGQAGPGAAVSITGGGSANGLAEYGNVNIGSGASTWSFRNNGTTGFPNNTIKPGNDQDLTIRTQSSGNAFTEMYQSSNSWEAFAEDDVTEANSAYAWIRADLATANTPRVFINNVRGSDGLDSTWTFDADGELTTPQGGRLGSAGKGWQGLDGGNGNPVSFTSFFANGNYAGCLTAYPDGSLNITTYGDGTGQLGQWNFANAVLTFPDSGLIDDNGGILRVKSPANTGVQLGSSDDQNYVTVTTGNVVIQTLADTDNHNWIFDNAGNLTLPNDTRIGNAVSLATQGPAVNSFGSDSYTGTFTTLDYTNLDTTWIVNGPGVVNGTIQSIDAAGQTIILTRSIGSPQFQNGQSYTFTGPVVGIGTNITVNGNTWTFAADGTLTLPDGSGVAGGFIYGAPGEGAGIINGGTGYQQFFVQDDGAFVQTSVANAGTTFNTWQFGLDGNLVFPNSATISNGRDDRFLVHAGPQQYVDVKGGQGPETDGGDARLRGGDASSNLGNPYAGGSAIIRGGSGINGGVAGWVRIQGGQDDDTGVLHGNVSIATYIPNTQTRQYWTFDNAGNLTVPGGGAVWTLGTDTVGLTANIADPYQVNLGLDYAANTATLAGNSSVYIQTNSGANSWAFGNTGNTTFPNGAVFTGYDLYAAANSYVELAGSTGNTYMGVGNDGVYIQTDWNGAQRQWSFSETGNLTLPAGGNLIVSSGGIVGSNANPAPYLSGFDSVSAITLSASGNIIGGNIVTSGSGGDITMTGGNITGAGNISAGNVSVTGNVSANNIVAEGVFSIQTANFNAVIGARYGVNTTGGAVTATLPASPATGGAVFFADAGGAYSSNNLNINPNGGTIMGASGNLTVSTDNQSVGLFWNGATWRTYNAG